MEKSFWLEKWQKMEIGFHLNEVNPALIKFWPSVVENASEGRVLVPLCGKTRDILWLLQQGHDVVGAELSESALAELAADIKEHLDLELIREDLPGGRIVWRHPRIQLFCGDFFELTPEDVGQIDWVYDRAALVALPDSMRTDYTQKVLELSPAAAQLLIVFEYDQEIVSGPPFSISGAEVSEHYGSCSGLNLLSEKEAIDAEPKFKSRGLTSFVIRCYQIKHG